MSSSEPNTEWARARNVKSIVELEQTLTTQKRRLTAEIADALVQTESRACSENLAGLVRRAGHLHNRIHIKERGKAAFRDRA